MKVEVGIPEAKKCIFFLVMTIASWVGCIPKTSWSLPTIVGIPEYENIGCRLLCKPTNYKPNLLSTNFQYDIQVLPFKTNVFLDILCMHPLFS